MTRKEIEFHFKNGNLEELLEKYDEVFDRVVYYEGCFRNEAIETPHDIALAMNEITALYSSLNIVSKIADAYKINLEDKYYNNRRIEIEKEGKKSVAGNLEKESSLHVSDYRRVRNIFEAYRDSCDKMIFVLQSSLKSTEREKGLQRG